MIHDQLIRADEKAIQHGAGVTDDTWRAKFRDEAPDIVKAYNSGYYSIPDDSAII